MLRDALLNIGANFGKIGCAEFVSDFGDAEKELELLRSSAAVADFSFYRKYSYCESGGAEFLDGLLPADILKLRYGRVCDTFLAGEDGRVEAEVFAANIDDRIFALCEASRAGIGAAFASEGDGFEDISDSWSLLSVDGPSAWKVARDTFGDDVLNLSYLSVEKYEFEGFPAYLSRIGKTGEFGYQVLLENRHAERMFSALLDCARSCGGGAAGMKAHFAARMRGNFFNVFAEGDAVGNPLELGLQWMIDFGKDSFRGSEPIFENRKKGVSKKLAAVVSDSPLAPGCGIFNGGERVGTVVVADSTGAENIALALFESGFEYPGFDWSAEPDGARCVRTLSRPTFLAESLVRGMDGV